MQDLDIAVVSAAQLKVVTKRAPTEAELKDLQFAWQVAKFVKSNAIVYVCAKNRHDASASAPAR